MCIGALTGCNYIGSSITIAPCSTCGLYLSAILDHVGVPIRTYVFPICHRPKFVELNIYAVAYPGFYVGERLTVDNFQPRPLFSNHTHWRTCAKNSARAVLIVVTDE